MDPSSAVSIESHKMYMYFIHGLLNQEFDVYQDTMYEAIILISHFMYLVEELIY